MAARRFIVCHVACVPCRDLSRAVSFPSHPEIAPTPRPPVSRTDTHRTSSLAFWQTRLVLNDLLMPRDGAPAPMTCSAKGCTNKAAWALRWNNPKLHTTGRRKTWLACPDHREHLSGFLDRRGFLREVEAA